MIWRIDSTFRQPRNATTVKVHPLIGTADRNNTSTPDQTRLTRQAGPVSPPMLAPNRYATLASLLTPADHRIEVRVNGRAAPVSGAS